MSAEVRAACTQAAQRLSSAIGTLNDSGQARAHTLCLAQLARLQLIAGKLDDVAHWTQLALWHAAGIGSARIDRALAVVRDTTVERYPNEPTVQQLVGEIDATINQPAQPDVEDEPSGCRHGRGPGKPVAAALRSR